MSSRDYYKILGVHPEASEEEIKDAYRELARRHHPDTQSGKGDSGSTGDAEFFKSITEAYAVLSNAEKRKEYDYEHGEKHPESSIYWLKKKREEGPSTPQKNTHTKSAWQKHQKNKTMNDERMRLILICTLGALLGIFCALLVFVIIKLIS
jgi:DnaJ-class molecular chaperone